MQAAKTILQQLGGNRFIAMTGAKNCLSDGNSLSFRLPSSPNFTKDGINYVKITLTPADEYNMEFGKIRGHSYKIIKTVEGVYWDSLQELFTEYTGLDTHL